MGKKCQCCCIRFFYELQFNRFGHWSKYSKALPHFLHFWTKDLFLSHGGNYSNFLSLKNVLDFWRKFGLSHPPKSKRMKFCVRQVNNEILAYFLVQEIYGKELIIRQTNATLIFSSQHFFSIFIICTRLFTPLIFLPEWECHSRGQL